MNKTTKDFWENILLGSAIFVLILITLIGCFYEDLHPTPEPCRTTAHRVYFPIATPLAAETPLTDAALQSWFETYRHEYFGSNFPDAKVIWADLPNLMGRTDKTPDGLFEIRIDRKSNPADKEALMTLLHEMSHIDTWHSEFDEHGRVWQYDMHRLADEGAFEDIW